MQFGKRIGPLARRVAAMQIPVYAGNASFFLLLSVFPVVSLLLSLLPYTPLTLDHLLAFCEEFAPDWTLRALEFFVRTLYASSSAAIISASAVLTLWSASKGMLSLLYGLDAVAEVRETRGYVQRRLLCVLYTVGMLLALLLTLGLYVGGQALLRFLTGRGFSLAAVLEPVLRHLHLVSLVLLTALFTGIFLALPDKRQRFVHVLPGSTPAENASYPSIGSPVSFEILLLLLAEIYRGNGFAVIAGRLELIADEVLAAPRSAPDVRPAFAVEFII